MHATLENIPRGGETLLKPLATFYAEAGRPMPQVRFIAGDSMPQPYRRLLVHDSDMTSTLQRFHNSMLRIRALASRRHGNIYEREVVLLTRDTGKIVEFGASHLLLDMLPATAQDEILREETPLGAVLQQFGVQFKSLPQGFFEVVPDDLIKTTLDLSDAGVLYGRCNHLATPGGATIAEIVEILPLSEK